MGNQEIVALVIVALVALVGLVTILELNSSAPVSVIEGVSDGENVVGMATRFKTVRPMDKKAVSLPQLSPAKSKTTRISKMRASVQSPTTMQRSCIGAAVVERTYLRSGAHISSKTTLCSRERSCVNGECVRMRGCLAGGPGAQTSTGRYVNSCTDDGDVIKHTCIGPGGPSSQYMFVSIEECPEGTSCSTTGLGGYHGGVCL